MDKEHDIRINRTLLHPWLDNKLTILLNKCAKKGIYLIITEGFRTKEYQDRLYAKGRTAPGSIVTNASGSSYRSQHMWGIAFDIAINDKKKLYDPTTIKKVAKIAKKVGLGWGGDWTSIVDMPHFYLKKWGSTTTVLKQQYGVPDRFMATWNREVNRKKGLVFWRNILKTKKILRIPDGKKVEVMYQKLWYAKVRYKGQTGFVNKKYLK